MLSNLGFNTPSHPIYVERLIEEYSHPSLNECEQSVNRLRMIPWERPDFDTMLGFIVQSQTTLFFMAQEISHLLFQEILHISYQHTLDDLDIFRTLIYIGRWRSLMVEMIIHDHIKVRAIFLTFLPKKSFSLNVSLVYINICVWMCVCVKIDPSLRLGRLLFLFTLKPNV